MNSDQQLQIGDIIKINTIDKFYHENDEHHERKAGKEKFNGYYVVTRAGWQGGSGHQFSPDGWYVICKSIKGSKIISFYQNNNFTCCIMHKKVYGNVNIDLKSILCTRARKYIEKNNLI